jgi:hypothetical protein
MPPKPQRMMSPEEEITFVSDFCEQTFRGPMFRGKENCGKVSAVETVSMHV